MTSPTGKTVKGLLRKRTRRPGEPGRITDAIGGEFTKQELQALGRLGTCVQVEAGSELIVEGQVGREAFVVVSGTANVVQGGDVIAQIGTGTIFGEAALIESQPRNATVVATSALSVFALSRSEFSSLLSECPRLDRSIRELAKQRSGS